MDVLVFSAHPDDAEFAMGGVLLKLSKSRRVVNVILTRGEAGTYGDPKSREKEAIEAGKRGGYEVRVLDFIDNHVEDTVENTKQLARVIREYTPRTIFVPYHTNNYSHTDGTAHPDHSALGSLVRKATRIAKFRNAQVEGEAHLTDQIIYYMVPKYTKPSFVVDVSDVVDELPELWRAHESQTQLKGGAIIEHLLQWRRAIGHSNRLEYAEAFLMEEPLHLDILDAVPEHDES